MQTTQLTDLLFPKHLCLRVNTKGGTRNWTAYRTAVETFLRLRGLDSHLRTSDKTVDSDEKGTERRQWETDDELARSVIILNIRGLQPEWLHKACAEKRGAAALWSQINDELSKRRTNQEGELNSLKGQKRRERKSDEQWLTLPLMALGALTVISIFGA
ncbi:hypothetical protein FKP32DRAFT_1756075 [Trametes sanguinea]|nr:hypothetical protein FKP32DRAFT_1756075 [Trametes sanguinea]